ncbi:MAG: hypothetical protein JWO38_6944 [Gemmataceae bacterium]|nr:hypothetical protein [Gemmataceae bacterium]
MTTQLNKIRVTDRLAGLGFELKRLIDTQTTNAITLQTATVRPKISFASCQLIPPEELPGELGRGTGGLLSGVRSRSGV